MSRKIAATAALAAVLLAGCGAAGGNGGIGGQQGGDVARRRLKEAAAELEEVIAVEELGPETAQQNSARKLLSEIDADLRSEAAKGDEYIANGNTKAAAAHYRKALSIIAGMDDAERLEELKAQLEEKLRQAEDAR